MRFPDAPSRPPPPERSTEPHSDEYYQHDIEADMRAAGLQHVHTVESDPRHRVVVRGRWRGTLNNLARQWGWRDGWFVGFFWLVGYSQSKEQHGIRGQRG